VYLWNNGYWGSAVGFYGGVNYGFGYSGVGYQGGYWRGNQFSYNTYVNNVGARGNFHNTYNKTVIVNTTNYVSYNGGNGGINARPSAAEQTAAHESHFAPTAAQSNQQRAAGQNHELLASVNHGRPAVAATSKPGEFSGGGVVPARGVPAQGVPARGVPPENKPAGSRAGADRPAVPAATDSRATASKASAPRAPENNPAEFKPAPARPATPERATPATRSNPSAPPTQQAASPRGGSAPKPPAQQQQRQQPQQQQQRQAAPKPAQAPRAEQVHPGDAKPDKPEGR
jgi:hypothetical protein